MFVKFPSIDRFEILPNQQLEKFRTANMVIATEKIDGSHITIWVPADKTQPIEIYSRNGNNFNQGDFDVVCREKLLKDCEKFRVKSEEEDFLGISLDGEVYGRRIMNRLPYQDQCKVVIYRATAVYEDERKNDVWPKTTLNEVMTYDGLDEYILPYVKKFIFTEDDPLDFEKLFEELPLPFDSKYTTEKSKAEGYVIDFFKFDTKINRILWLGCIKRKDEDFNDMKAKSNITPEDYNYALGIQKEFAKYALNENRILDAYGKGYKKLSELIPEVLHDAKEDFLKTHDAEMIEILKNNKQLNKVAFNLGSKLFVMAKQVLNKHFGLEY